MTEDVFITIKKSEVDELIAENEQLKIDNENLRVQLADYYVNPKDVPD